jgi:hypothetical protein
VYRPASIFLIGTQYEKHRILYSLFTPPSADEPDGEAGIDMATNDTISFDFRAPLGIDPFDLPIEPPAGSGIGGNSADTMYGIGATVTASDDGEFLAITVLIGRGLLDGSWHAVWVDLGDAIASALDDANLDANDWGMETATAVLAGGQMFRMDNLMFRGDPAGHELIQYPDMFEMGPLYAQLFEPYRYLFIADYELGDGDTDCEYIFDLMLDVDNFITDPNEIEDYWRALGADANDFGERPDTAISAILDRDFTVDPTLPIFADDALRIDANGPGDSAQCIIDAGTLGWNSTIGGYGANGVQSFLLQPLPIFPYDGMPTYMPTHWNSIGVVETYGKPYFNPTLVFFLESALWNAGVQVWPNVAAMDFTPQYFEDLILTIEVTNGVHSDVRTFPISVVNYPVENYPPVLQLNIEDQIFYVGEVGEYLVNFIDPDCFIFSMSPAPATTHTPAIAGSFRTDMDGLIWGLTINGLPNYQYGPWIEQIINPSSGLISWVPKFEGAYDTIISCADARGGTAFGEITIFSVNRGTWLNHPPIILSQPTEPVVIKAGEEFILHTPNFAVEDPDGDQIYASCNIGTCGRGPSGDFIWKFQSNFPGSYLVEIIFYDIRGGYAILNFFLDVKPWWTY